MATDRSESRFVLASGNRGKLAEINNYCRCDVLDTYFVFLRTRVLVGQLTLDVGDGGPGDRQRRERGHAKQKARIRMRDRLQRFFERALA